MFAIIIQEKGGEQRRLMFDKPEVTIGRVQGNDIVLPKGNVSKRHARIVLKDGKFIIVDLKSTNGTYVNGRKITSPLVIKETDKIYIGDFIMGVDENGAGSEMGGGMDMAQASPPGGRPMPPAPMGGGMMMGGPGSGGYDAVPPGGASSPELIGAAMSRPAVPAPLPRIPPPAPAPRQLPPAPAAP